MITFAGDRVIRSIHRAGKSIEDMKAEKEKYIQEREEAFAFQTALNQKKISIELAEKVVNREMSLADAIAAHSSQSTLAKPAQDSFSKK